MKTYLLTLLRSLNINQLKPTTKGEYRFAICSELLLEMQSTLQFLTNHPGDKHGEARLLKSYKEFRYYKGAGHVDKTEIGEAAMIEILLDINGIDVDNEEQLATWNAQFSNVMDNINDLRTSN